MKRSFVVAFMVIALVLTASSAFAERQAFNNVNYYVNIDVPQGWTATTGGIPVEWGRENITGNHVYLYKTGTNNDISAFMFVFIDEKKRDANGNIQSLLDIYNIYYNKLLHGRQKYQWRNGGYEFDYTSDGNYWTKAFVFDSNQFSGLEANHYCLVRCAYPFDPNDEHTQLEDFSRDDTSVGKIERGQIVDIMNSFQFRSTTPQPGPTPDPSPDPSPDPTPTPTPTPTKGGGGGCSAMGTGLFAALMFAVSAMVYRRR